MKLKQEQSDGKKAVIYTRVSSLEQVESGNSLVTQERACREFASKNGYDVSDDGVFVERGESAKTANRTQLQLLLRYCAQKKKNISAVIVYKIDRLSRDTDDYSQLRLLLRSRGVVIKSTTEAITDDPQGRFLENTMANVAQFDNEIRAERCTNGMLEATREGRYVWGAPVGYSNGALLNGKPTISVNEKALLVKEAFELVATGLYPTDEAWRIMVKRGLTTARAGRPISRQYFHEMLRNCLYMGLIDKFDEQNEGKFKPIVSKEVFMQVHAVLNKKGHNVGTYKTDNPEFPLRRFVISPDGVKLTGSFSKGKYPYYRFGQKGSNYGRDDVEDKFALLMDSYRFNKQQIKKLKEFVKTQFHEATAEEQRAKIGLKKRISELECEQTALVQKNLKGTISDDVLKKQLSRIEEEMTNVQMKLIALNDSDVSPEEAVAFAEGYLKAPSSVWKDADISVQTQLQWFQFPSGVVFDGKIFGTNEVASVFKTKELLSNPLSSKVDLSGFEPLTSSLQMRRSTN